MQFVFFQYAKQLTSLLYLCLFSWLLTSTSISATQLLDYHSPWLSSNMGEIILSDVIDLHDALQEKNAFRLLSLFVSPERPAFHQFNDLITAFNHRSRKLSQNIEEACSSLIATSYDLHLFSSLGEEHPTKQPHMDLVPTFWDYLSTPKPVSIALPWSEKEKLMREQSFHRAKFFCAYGYNLQFLLNETTKGLQIVGNKEYYPWMSDKLNDLIEQADTISSASNLLLSTQQRLIILKKLTEQFADIVLYRAYTKLEKIIHVPSAHTLSSVQQYLDSELLEIGRLVAQLNQIFPLQLEQLHYQYAMSKASDDLKQFVQDIVEEHSDVTQRLGQREAERHSNELISSWNATKTKLSAWKKVVIQSSGFVLQSVGHISSTMITEIANGLLLKPVFDVLYAILRCIVSHPVGCLLLLVMFSWMIAPFAFAAKVISAPFSFILSKFNNKKSS